MRQQVLKGIILLLIATLVHGCSTTRPVPLSPEGIGTLRPGQKVRVVTRDDQVHQVQVSEVTEQALIGGDERIPFEDITHLDRKEFSGGRTTVLLAGIAAGIAILVAVIVSNFSMGPIYSQGGGQTSN